MIDSTLLLLFKAKVTPTGAQEVKLAEDMGRAWKRAAKKGVVPQLRALTSGKPTAAKIATFVKRLGLSLRRPLSAKQVDAIRARLTSIWKTVKRVTASDLKINFSFAAVDQKAVAALARHQVFWIGDLYDTHLAKRIGAVASDVLIERGLPQAEAGRVLRQAIFQEMSLRPGGKSRFARAIPSRFAGNLDLYFRGLASTAAHQARTFSKLTAFGEGGIVRFQLINPNDERTGRICQEMSGQVFTVASGVKQMQRVLSATTPDEVREAAPWLSATEIDEVTGGAPAGSAAATDALVNADATILPPFHPHCRTEPVVLD